MSQSPLYGRATALELTQPQSRPEKPVLLVTNYRLDNQHSMLRFATLLADGLRSQGVEVTVTQPTALLARLLPSWQRLQKGMRMADKFLLFPLLLRIAARRFDCRLEHVPNVMRVFEACMALPAFQQAQPSSCPDNEA